MQAILFRRADDGIIRLSMKKVPVNVAVVPPAGVGSNLTGPFLVASQHIMQANNELDLGKISFHSISRINDFFSTNYNQALGS